MLGALYRAADLEKWSFTDKTNKPVMESPQALYDRLQRVRDRAAQVANNYGKAHGGCDPWAGILTSSEQFRNSVIVCQLSAEKRDFFRARRIDSRVE
jgi:hypothetical protein